MYHAEKHFLSTELQLRYFYINWNHIRQTKQKVLWFNLSEYKTFIT
jgi:hypothetical protein